MKYSIRLVPVKPAERVADVVLSLTRSEADAINRFLVFSEIGWSEDEAIGGVKIDMRVCADLADALDQVVMELDQESELLRGA